MKRFVLALLVLFAFDAKAMNNCVTATALPQNQVGGVKNANGAEITSACIDFTTGDASAIFYVSRPWSLLYDPDTLAEEPGGTDVTISLYRCPSATAARISCHNVLSAVITGDDGTAAESDATVYDLPSGYYYFIPSGAPDVSATPRVRIDLTIAK